jgi:hypothetical protein
MCINFEKRKIKITQCLPENSIQSNQDTSY